MKVILVAWSMMALCLVVGANIAVGKDVSNICQSSLTAVNDDVQTANKTLEKILDLQKNGKPYISHITGSVAGNPNSVDEHDREKKYIKGVPQCVKLIDHRDMVFRHYTSADGLKSILSSQQLMNGYVPYVSLVNGYEMYEDLAGIFLTLNKVGPGAVGLEDAQNTPYIDFYVPEHVPVLEIEPGNIYLIPLPKQFRPWLVTEYKKYRKDPESYKHASMYQRTFDEMDERPHDFDRRYFITIDIIEYSDLK